jgi:hypothetical protein
MSLGHVPQPTPRVIGGRSEAPHEEHVETEVGAPVAAQPARASDARPAPSPVMQPVPERDEPVAAASTARQERQAPRAARESQEPRTVVEHRTIVESVAAEHPPRERVALPPAARWLEEDRSAADPLVGSAETDALRDLMQQVRRWTSSAPTVIEPSAPSDQAAPSPAVTPVAPAPEPSHVSIGNVTITVEDAPAPTPRGGRVSSPARTTSDRMARHHIRGG